MTNRYQHKRNSTPGAVPTAAQIEVGEIAINLADKKLFSKDSSNTVFEIVGGATSSAWQQVSANTTINAASKTVVVASSVVGITINATFASGQEAIVANSRASNSEVVVRVGATRRFRPLSNDDDIVLIPGETLYFSAANTTVFDIL